MASAHHAAACAIRSRSRSARRSSRPMAAVVQSPAALEADIENSILVRASCLVISSANTLDLRDSGGQGLPVEDSVGTALAGSPVPGDRTVAAPPRAALGSGRPAALGVGAGGPLPGEPHDRP